MRTGAFAVVVLGALAACGIVGDSWDICGANETGVNTDSPEGDNCRWVSAMCGGVVCQRTGYRCGSRVDGSVVTDEFQETFDTSTIVGRHYSVAGRTTFQVEARLETKVGASDSVWVEVFFGETRKCRLDLRSWVSDQCSVEAPSADQEVTVSVDSARTNPNSWFIATVTLTARYVKASHWYTCRCGSTC